jgi:hypothetical protein
VQPTPDDDAAAVDIPAPASPDVPAVKRRKRLLPIVGLGLLVLLLLGAGVALYVYDKATAPDRSTPSVVVQQFLTIVFVEESDARLDLFVCSRWDRTAAAETTKALVDPDANASWDTVLVVTQEGNAAEVTARLRFRFPEDFAPSGEERWRFRLINEGGWRVCAVQRE